MSLNLGLECLNTGVKTVSTEQLMSEYVGCEELVSATERFSAYGDQLFATFDNLLAIRKTAKQFGSNEAMNVLNSLVGSEFGGTFSMEEATEANKTVWQKIKEFFAKIWEWIKTFFYRVLNFFTDAENRLMKYKAAINNLPSDAKLEWKYSGLKDDALLSVANEVAQAYTKIGQAADEEALSKIVSDTLDKLASDIKKAEKVLVNGKDATVAVIDNAIKMIRGLKEGKNMAAGEYNKAKAEVKKAEGADNIKAAKLAQKKAAAEVKIVNKLYSYGMRTVASICANIPLKNQAKKK